MNSARSFLFTGDSSSQWLSSAVISYVSTLSFKFSMYTWNSEGLFGFNHNLVSIVEYIFFKANFRNSNLCFWGFPGTTYFEMGVSQLETYNPRGC